MGIDCMGVGGHGNVKNQFPVIFSRPTSLLSSGIFVPNSEQRKQYITARRLSQRIVNLIGQSRTLSMRSRRPASTMPTSTDNIATVDG